LTTLVGYEKNFYTMNKYDLPDADLALYNDFFSKSKSDELYNALIQNIQWRQDEIKMFGKTMNLPRLTAWYGNEGCSYTYSGITMQPLSWNKDLKIIKDQIEAVTEVSFNSCLLNFYRSGSDSMGWHQDNEKELGSNPIIASVSFGETRPFQLKHINLALPKTDIPLAHGSLLIMKGPTQHFWKHQIPKTSRNIKPRINLTFRIIKS